MSRRSDPHQLRLPHVPAPVSRSGAGARTPALDPYAGVRCAVLVRALMAHEASSARHLARTLHCSPDTIARLRDGRTPRPALRARLIRLAWHRLDRRALDEAALAPAPVDNVRWHARGAYGYATAHGYPLEPAGPSPHSLCDLDVVGQVSADWPREPDRFARICPGCLRRIRETG